MINENLFLTKGEKIMENKKAGSRDVAENQTRKNRLHTEPGLTDTEGKKAGDFERPGEPTAEETARQSKEGQEISSAENRRDILKAK